MTTETKKAWKFHYQLTKQPDERLLEAAKDQLRVMADRLTLEHFTEEEVEK